MDIPGKLRADLKRIYGANDPLNYIEDVRVEAATLGGDERLLTVQLRVPTRFEKYMESSSFKPACSYALARSPLFGNHEHRAAMDANTLAAVMAEIQAMSPKVPSTKEDIVKSWGLLKPTKIIYNGPKTIVFWPDGSKTIVSLMEGQEYDEYTAYCAAVVKKMFGSTYKAKKFLEAVAVRPELKKKKVKYEQMEMPETVEDYVHG